MTSAIPLFDVGHLADDDAGFDELERCYTPRSLATQLIDLTVDLTRTVRGRPRPEWLTMDCAPAWSPAKQLLLEVA